MQQWGASSCFLPKCLLSLNSMCFRFRVKPYLLGVGLLFLFPFTSIQLPLVYSMSTACRGGNS